MRAFEFKPKRKKIEFDRLSIKPAGKPVGTGLTGPVVAKMASHAIFQYNVLTIDDTHNTWTNMIVKMNIRRLLGSSDDKEKISVVRPEGPPLRGFRLVSLNRIDSPSLSVKRTLVTSSHRSKG